MADKSRLTRSRGVYRGQITKLQNRVQEVFAHDTLSEDDQDSLHSILFSFQEKMSFVTDIDKQLTVTQADEELETFLTETDDYNTQVKECFMTYERKLKRRLLPVITSDNNPTNPSQTSPSRRHVNLPKLTLKQFDGDILQWTEFYDAFKSAIDSDSGLTNVQKFHYLQAQVTDEAARVISGLSLTDSNYIHAMDLLKKRYGQTHQIIHAYMRALWELRKPDYTCDSLRDFYDRLESYIRGLSTLGKKIDSYGDLLVPVILDKLPSSLRKQIARDHDDCEWTIDDLKSSLLREIKALQAGDVSSVSDDNRLYATAAFYTPVSYRFSKPLRVKPSRKCAFCKGDHTSNDCMVISDKRKRQDIVVREKLCYNCLGKHRAADCKSHFRCRTCTRKHHTSICNESKTRSWRNSIKSKKGTKYLENCQLDTVCKACVRPCIHSPLHLVTCSLHCYNEERVCFESCTFLKLAHTVRPGFCPAPHRASGFASACVETCREDGDCEESLKCCSNGPGCGFTCQKAVSVNKDLPRIPIIHQLIEKRKGHSVFVTWKDVPIKPTNRSRSERLDVIYVLEARKTLRERPEWGADTPWYSIIQTTRPNFLVRGIQAGYWFQFRVAAITMQGMRGYSKPSTSYKSSRDIQPPRVPEKFAEDGFKVHDGKVDVVLLWQRSRSDLPVMRYMVYYSKRLKTISPVYVSLHVKKKRVNGDKTTCVLENLEPDYTYFVQVEAIARYGDVRLKSKRASMYITTYAIPHTSKSVSTTQSPLPALNDDARNLPKMISIHNLTVLQPFYYNGLVKVEALWNVSEDLQTEVEKYMIRWTPDAQCIDSSYRSDRRSRTMAATTHDQKFELYDLLYKCHYVMKVQAVNSVGRPGPVRQASFSIPSCDSLDVRGETKPECPATGPPPKVRNLNYNLYITGPNITAVIKWRPPQTDIPITGYTIRWGEMSLSGKNVHGQPSSRKYQSKPGRLKAKALSRRVHRIELHQLNEDAKYRVFVHGVSASGEGLMSKLDFSTPVVSTTDAPPDINVFMQKGSKKQEQAFESRGHLHGYRSAPPTTKPTANQKSKSNGKGDSQSLFSHRVHILIFILSFTVMYLL